MPALAMFFGIIVRMQSERGGFIMLRTTAVSVIPMDNYIVNVKFDNGEEKKFDVKPYIKGEWYGNLKDVAYFKSVSVDGYTIVWPDGQDICPDELYELSYA